MSSFIFFEVVFIFQAVFMLKSQKLIVAMGEKGVQQFNFECLPI